MDGGIARRVRGGGRRTARGAPIRFVRPETGYVVRTGASVRAASPESPVHRTPLAVVVALLIAPASAGADVASLAVVEDEELGKPATVRITTTAADGRSRALGPFLQPHAPSGLLAAPGGRHLLLLPNDQGQGDALASVLALDDPAARPVPLAMPANVEIARPYSQLSWTPDGSEVVLGDVQRRVPKPGTDPDDDAEDQDDVSWTAVRCPVATHVCTEIPGTPGSAVGVPGGALVSSSPLSLLPIEFVLGGLDEVRRPEWASPRTAYGRLLRSVANDPRVAETRIDGPAPRTVSRFAGPSSKGLPYAQGIVGGASGALVTRYTATYRLRTRGDGRVRLRASGSGPRLLTVAPDGTSRIGPVPRVRVARRDLSSIGRRRPRGPQRLSFIPGLGRPDGGWLGFADRKPDPPFLRGEVLAALGDDGRARVVRVGGRAATVARIVDGAPGLRPFVSYTDYELVGYEPATRSAVLHIEWRERRPGSRRTRERDEAFRVPVDGTGRPTVVPAGAATAW